MHFEKLHKCISYLLVLTSVAPTLMGMPHGIGLFIAATLAGSVSWFAEAPQWPFARVQKLWSVVQILCFGYVFIGLVQGHPALFLGIEFLLALIVVKLFNRRSARDYFHLYVLSFASLLAASVINQEFWYGIFFIAYLTLVVWALVMLHLRSEAETIATTGNSAQIDNAPSSLERTRHDTVRRLLQSRDVVTQEFLARSALLSLAMLGAAAAFFFMFPRVGFGVGGSGAGTSKKTGFSEGLDISRGERLQGDSQIVMRVRPDIDKTSAVVPNPLHLRGAVFDTYQHGRWSRAPNADRTFSLAQSGDLLLTDQLVRFEEPDPRKTHDGLINVSRLDVYLDALDTNILFAPEKTVAIKVPRDNLRQPAFEVRRSSGGELRMIRSSGSGVLYSVYARNARSQPAALRNAQAQRPAQLSHYLNLPQGFSPRVQQLAQKLSQGQTTPYDKALAIARYLRSEMRYTLTAGPTPQGSDPIAHFLFRSRMGTCEHYASTLTLMLRSVGLHARSVNGFLANEWNPYGQYWVVRQSHAHAWTEVHFAGAGWITLDATPSRVNAAAASSGWLSRVVMIIDTLRQKWQAYIISYDLNRQAALAHKVRASFRGERGGKSVFTKSPSLRQILFVGASIALVLAYAHWRRAHQRKVRRTRKPQRTKLATRLYQKALSTTALQGVQRHAQQTPLEFAEALQMQSHRQAETLAQLTQFYYQARFDHDPSAIHDAERNLHTALNDLTRVGTDS